MRQITPTSADAADPAAYHAAARRALRAATARSAALLGSIADPAVPIPGPEWSVAEAAAHLVVIAQANAGYAAGLRAPVIELDDRATMAAANARARRPGRARPGPARGDARLGLQAVAWTQAGAGVLGLSVATARRRRAGRGAAA